MLLRKFANSVLRGCSDLAGCNRTWLYRSLVNEFTDLTNKFARAEMFPQYKIGLPCVTYRMIIVKTNKSAVFTWI